MRKEIRQTTIMHCVSGLFLLPAWMGINYLRNDPPAKDIKFMVFLVSYLWLQEVLPIFMGETVLRRQFKQLQDTARLSRSRVIEKITQCQALEKRYRFPIISLLLLLPVYLLMVCFLHTPSPLILAIAWSVTFLVLGAITSTYRRIREFYENALDRRRLVPPDGLEAESIPIVQEPIEAAQT